MSLFGVLPQAQIFHSVVWNFIFLLATMMFIANVPKEPRQNLGLFGQPQYPIMVNICLYTVSE